jgi:hypothetical protein
MKPKRRDYMIFVVVGVMLTFLLFATFMNNPVKIPRMIHTVLCWSWWRRATVRKRTEKQCLICHGPQSVPLSAKHPPKSNAWPVTSNRCNRFEESPQWRGKSSSRQPARTAVKPPSAISALPGPKEIPAYRLHQADRSETDRFSRPADRYRPGDDRPGFRA